MKPLGKSIKRHFSLKEIAIVLAAIVISVTVGVAVFNNLKNDVVIVDNGKTVTVKTMKTTVKDALQQNGIDVNPYDYISLPLDAKLQKMKTNTIYISRAVPVTVFVDGHQKTFMTYKSTIREALSDSGIKLAAKDKLEGAGLGDTVVKDMSFKIVRVKEETTKQKIPVTYNTVTRANAHMDEGKTVTVRQGKEGIREKVFRVVFEDGKRVVKELIKDAVVLNPINRIVEYGTIMNFKTSRGDVVRYSKVLNMRATSYTASYQDTGKHPGESGFGVTATGMRARRGVIAVDPRVIPLGTKVFIEGLGRVPDYGFAIAADTGGAIKGNLIDLYFEPGTTDGCSGRRKVKVYILTD